MVPSWQRIAISILKNDHYLTELGGSAPKSEFYNILKKIEIQQRHENAISAREAINHREKENGTGNRP